MLILLCYHCKMGTTDKTTLGDRMKEYECATRTVLQRRVPVIIRVDGKGFHNYTRGLKPFDPNLIAAMDQTAVALCDSIQGAQFAYIQSDEISVLVHGYKTFEAQPWFANQVQKMASISAATAAVTMTMESTNIFGHLKPAIFDSRVFVVPENDVCNYFLWRQQDWLRNSKQMLARSLFSHKELHKKNVKDLVEMCLTKGQDWSNLPIHHQRGRCISRVTTSINGIERTSWKTDNNIPVFSDDRYYVNKHLETESGKPHLAVGNLKLHFEDSVSPEVRERIISEIRANLGLT